jgi:molybdopterin/thiamine biosynthesis adenylyltransferase
MKIYKSNDIDYWRQLDIFSPDSFDIPIHVIGAGATGSYIVHLLSKMGCKDITVYDFDKVENHNLPNQVYGLEHIGQLKVDALKKIIKRDCGIDIKTHSTEVKTLDKIEGILFVLTDTMHSRKSIWESVKNNPKIKFYIETRMGAEFGTIYSLIPLLNQSEYEKTLYSDEQAERSACTRQSISPTVATIAGMAVFSLLRFLNKEDNPNKVMVSLLPSMMLSQSWTNQNKGKNNKTKTVKK